MSDASRSINDLLTVMVALRTPGTGCPWDLAQSFKTIAPYTIEEAYEVADAIQRDDMPDLKDELGDLLLQVVYHARLAEEQGAFAFNDVVEGITAKMLRRHPHVFGSEAERVAGAAPGFWARIKAEERAEGTSAGTDQSEPSVLRDVPVALPAFTRAVKLQDKAAKVGFDWPSFGPLLDKLKEELRELEDVLTDTGSSNRAGIEEEFGDLLFVMANVARHLKLDPEMALQATNLKFTRRFQAIERRLAEHGRTPAQSTLAEMDALWDEVKAEERSPAIADGAARSR